ncbi:hypothetical protein [Novosphingobium aquimarinum]|uniref:hypothetical protein n=1 Tax=Novosphingobium aquimarinum TaxID=2682494 RepID=UPI0012EC4ACB|nr:hypothetical protein [Novosphingobium aquimarinum]
MADDIHHELAVTFLTAIEEEDWACLHRVCAPGLLIWHNVDREDKIFFDYLPFLVNVRRRAANWKYRETAYWEVRNRFFRQSLLDARSADGVDLTIATCIIGEVEAGRITRIDEYYNFADIAPLLDASGS